MWKESSSPALIGFAVDSLAISWGILEKVFLHLFLATLSVRVTEHHLGDSEQHL